MKLDISDIYTLPSKLAIVTIQVAIVTTQKKPDGDILLLTITESIRTLVQFCDFHPLLMKRDITFLHLL